MRYALYFVPHKLEREKLALLRRQLCKRFENRRAVMYPVHLAIVRSLTFGDYKTFMRDLEKHCKNAKPIKIKLADRLVSRSGWGGIEVAGGDALAVIQHDLMQLCDRHGEVEPFAFDPHISLVQAKGLPSLHSVTSPVKKLMLDRITLAIQTDEGQPYRIAKHIALGTDAVDLED